MTKRWSSLIFCCAGMFGAPPSAPAQTVYTASRQTRIQAGGGFLYLEPDYVNQTIQGVSLWADYDFSRFIGAELAAALGNVITPNDIAETSYMIGPRFMYRHRKFIGYGKLLVGRATITNQAPGANNASSSYNEYAFGGGVEYRALRWLNVRLIDVTLEKWPDFEPHTLSPVAISIGAAYIIK